MHCFVLKDWFCDNRPPEGLVEKKETGISEVIFKNSGFVASTGIEPVSGASETLILSIVLRGRSGR